MRIDFMEIYNEGRYVETQTLLSIHSLWETLHYPIQRRQLLLLPAAVPPVELATHQRIDTPNWHSSRKHEFNKPTLEARQDIQTWNAQRHKNVLPEEKHNIGGYTHSTSVRGCGIKVFSTTRSRYQPSAHHYNNPQSAPTVRIPP